MVKTALPAILIAFFCASAAPPTVSITGTVTDTAAAGIGNARVYLKHYPAIHAHTDTAGAFTLPSTNPVRYVSPKQATGGPSIKGNRIVFSIGRAGQRFAFDMFGLNGAMAASIRLEGLSAGSHAVTLPKTAHGMYVARMAAGNAIHTAKMAIGANGAILFPASRAAAGVNASLSKSGEAPSIDSLIVVARGFRNAQKGISSYDQKNFSVLLSASNPWRPTSYPEIVGNMAKILAKDRDFEMGQPDPDIGGEGLSALEQAVHTVTFTSDFWMDMTEVAQKEYAAIMEEAYPDFVKPAWTEKYGLGDDYPAYCLSWADAALYCNARSRKDTLDTVYRYTAVTGKPGEITFELAGVSADMTKNGYRLPTEAEWEYACKGGTFTDFNWERDMSGYPRTFLDSIEVNSYEVWRPLSWNKGQDDADYGTHPAGEKIHNYYHLFDMAGNVSEFCNDYKTSSYSFDAVTDPTGPSNGDSRVIRGGNWGSDARQLRSANRTFSAPDSSQFFIGFRTVRRIP
jgi:formylglycine-generating enzyme required for sulfatase activity